jgi:hypothetical protein
MIEHRESGAMPGKRKRQFVVSVPLYEQEKKELQQAANQSGLALSLFIRTLARTTVRRGGGVRVEPVA